MLHLVPATQKLICFGNTCVHIRVSYNANHSQIGILEPGPSALDQSMKSALPRRMGQLTETAFWTRRHGCQVS